MEPTRFDELTRRLAAGASRRTVLRGLVGGLAGSLGVTRVTTANADKVTICHHTSSPANPWVQQSIAAAAVPDRLAAGDTVLGTSGSCRFCGDTCMASEVCDPDTGCHEGVCTSYAFAGDAGHCIDYYGDNPTCIATSFTPGSEEPTIEPYPACSYTCANGYYARCMHTACQCYMT